MTYNQINESNELDTLSFAEIERLVDLGLLDNDLLIIYEYVKNGSVGDLELVGSTLTHLPNWLVEVGGDLLIQYSSIEDIPDSLILDGSIIAQESKLKEFRRSVVFGDLDLDQTEITKLPNKLTVYGYLALQEVMLMEFPDELSVQDSLYIYKSSFMNLSITKITDKYNIGTIRIDKYLIE